jgi:MFS family permease
MRIVTGEVGRDAHVIGVVGVGHFTSHFFHLALPPLFPVLREELGVSYVALALTVSFFYGASGLGQTVAGFLVDRFGARAVLLAGMALLAGAVGGAGLVTSYGMLLVTALLAGLGNSVFHPADYAILNASVEPRRLGRAYSVHGLGGSLGWATAPPVVVGLTQLVGWRGALLAVGALGILAALAVASQSAAFVDHRETQPARRGVDGGVVDDLRVLLVRPILVAFAYFVLTAGALIGLQAFAVPAILAAYDAPLAVATGSLTALLLGSAAGMLAGGILADRTARHDVLAAGGIALAAGLTLVVATGAPPVMTLPAVMALAGFCLGATSPSRDLLVRAAAPAGASGKVYGLVYSGFDLGSAVLPLGLGWLLDRGEPRAVFVAVSAVLLLTIVTVVQVRRHRVPSPVRA